LQNFSFLIILSITIGRRSYPMLLPSRGGLLLFRAFCSPRLRAVLIPSDLHGVLRTAICKQDEPFPKPLRRDQIRRKFVTWFVVFPFGIVAILRGIPKLAGNAASPREDIAVL